MKSLRDPRRRPTHPGVVLRDDVLPALGMTQEAFADAIGVHRVTLSGIERAPEVNPVRAAQYQNALAELIAEAVAPENVA